MHWLRERVAQRESRAATKTAWEKTQQHFDKYAAYLQFRDEQDERLLAGGRTPRSSANAEKRGIERLFKLEAEAFQTGFYDEDYISMFTECYGETPAEHRNKLWADMIDKHYGTQPSHSTEPVSVPVDPENRKDVRDNYLYSLWTGQLRSARPVRTYPVYALFVAIKAGIELVTGQQRMALSSALRFDGPYPDRDRLIAFKQAPEYDSNDVRAHLKLAGDVDGLLELSEALMVQYSDFVRAERDIDSTLDRVVDSPLPDDPGTTSLTQRYEVPEYIRIESAVEAYRAKEGTSVEIAQRYRVGEKRLQNVLRERGLLAKRGGDRRAKK